MRNEVSICRHFATGADLRSEVVRSDEAKPKVKSNGSGGSLDDHVSLGIYQSFLPRNVSH